MKVTVIDPAGFRHALEFDGGQWHGMENIAHWHEPHAGRLGIVAALQTALTRNLGPVKVALPHGFGYC